MITFFFNYFVAIFFVLGRTVDASFMKLFNSKLENVYNCNDHMEKLWLKVEFLDVNNTHSLEQLYIEYDYTPCMGKKTGIEAKSCGKFKELTKIKWTDYANRKGEKFLKIHFNSVYEYKFQVTLRRAKLSPLEKGGVPLNQTNQNVSYTTERVCGNLSFKKFGSCDQYLLVIGTNQTVDNCSLELVRRNEASGFIKYFYF